MPQYPEDVLPLPAFLSATPKHVRQACIERMAQWRLVAALGDVDYAATARTLLQRHCDACTAACAGCSADLAPCASRRPGRRGA